MTQCKYTACIPSSMTEKKAFLVTPAHKRNPTLYIICKRYLIFVISQQTGTHLVWPAWPGHWCFSLMNHLLGCCAAANKLFCHPWSCALMSSLSSPLTSQFRQLLHVSHEHRLSPLPLFVMPHLVTRPTHPSSDIGYTALSFQPTTSSYSLGTFWVLVCVSAMFLTAFYKLGCCCLLQSSKGLLSTRCGGSPQCPWLLVWISFLCSILTLARELSQHFVERVGSS